MGCCVKSCNSLLKRAAQVPGGRRRKNILEHTHVMQACCFFLQGTNLFFLFSNRDVYLQRTVEKVRLYKTPFFASTISSTISILPTRGESAHCKKKKGREGGRGRGEREGERERERERERENKLCWILKRKKVFQ